ncbi:hypothetical protein D3C86_1280340 [compost metagenome]
MNWHDTLARLALTLREVEASDSIDSDHAVFFELAEFFDPGPGVPTQCDEVRERFVFAIQSGFTQLEGVVSCVDFPALSG